MALREWFVATLDDDSTEEVAIDQRDWCAMEAKEFPESAFITARRFMIWNALHREGRTKDSFEKWNTRTCIHVEAKNEEESATPEVEGEQSAHPGR